MRYLLLLKRLFKKKSYILMLIIVPLMANMLIFVSQSKTAVMRIGVYAVGQDESSEALRNTLSENDGAIEFVQYWNLGDMYEAVRNNSLDEAWQVPDDLDHMVAQLAANQYPDQKIQVIVREEGLSHLLGREIITSKVYPLVAEKIMTNYINLKLYDGQISDENLAKLKENFEKYSVDGSLFVSGYLDETKEKPERSIEETTGVATSDIEKEETNESVILMPMRGILAMWLLLCGLATSMYYLEDEKNGLFIWWNSKCEFLRELGYYLVAFTVPVIITVGILLQCNFYGASIGLKAVSLAVYVLNIIFFSMIIRRICRQIKVIGILTPALIITTLLLSPVFLNIKELRPLQNFCPTFHYLSSIHDTHYLWTLIVFTVMLAIVINLMDLLHKKTLRG